MVAFGVAESPEGNGPYGSPAWPYFSMKKSRQKSLGECPETPDASVHPARKAKGRLPGAGLDDAYKVPQAHFYVGGAEPSAACGGCSEAEHPQRSKKSSKRAARRFFRAPQGGRDCDWPRRGPGGSRTRRFSRLTARPFLTIMELENIPRKEC